MTVVRLLASDGSEIAFDDTIIAQGGMKDVYLSTDGTRVAAFFRTPPNDPARARLTEIVGRYRERIFEQEGGSYWRDVFCWPTAMVEWNGRTGIVVPKYREPFFFKYGSVNGDMLGIRGKEKEGKWFASASNRAKFLDAREKGNLLTHLSICLKIARAVRRLHAAGLAHSDLSYKNVLIDPEGGNAAIIDIDGLVVPGKFAPDVVGTPDFIAPEVVATQGIDRADPRRALPSIATDRHALAVLLYMYLFFRHPLRGCKVHDEDPVLDETLGMGEHALFVEHPTDRSNRLRIDQATPAQLPWADTAKLPYTIAGPFLAPLFEAAFVTTLHVPHARPSADDWETALIRTIDLLQPCHNPRCAMKWFVVQNQTGHDCPYCDGVSTRLFPVLEFYAPHQSGASSPDGHRLMIYDGQSLFRWHVDRRVIPNEKLHADDRKRVGYFQLHRDAWYFVNETLENLTVNDGAEVLLGAPVRLADGQRLAFSGAGARTAVVTLSK